jgi:adenylate kinase|tara:strand:- start:1006 stop:1689 length:684 start_codon:yes stop_codon:yes gene_type:complete
MIRFKTFLEEGVNDPAIFKAVFLAGGPGSGKSFIVGKTGLPALGFRVVNSDDAFENALKKAGLTTTPDDIFSVKGQELRGKAKKLTAKKQEIYIKGRLGLVIDGTGKDFNKVQRQAKALEGIGYDTAMIYVNTDLETALQRNRDRDRTLPDDEVESMWKTVQKNIGAFQRQFGKQDFVVVDNSIGKNYEKETVRAYREMTKFVNREPDSRLAKLWIKQEKEKRGITR